MATRKIHAILFDLGETLLTFGRVDTARLFQQGGGRAYEFLKNANQPVGSLKKFLFRNMMTIRFFYLLSWITKRDFDSFEVLKKGGQKKGIRLSEQQWQQYAWCWYEPLSLLAEVEADLKQTLEKLKSAGIKLGIVSNTFINAVTLEKHLEQLGLLEFFPIRQYSYQFKFRKPDSRIFTEAAEKIECRPENILFVGDRLDTDVKGALKLNMLPVIKQAYTNIRKKIPKNIKQIEKLSELPNFIAKINGQFAKTVGV